MKRSKRLVCAINPFPVVHINPEWILIWEVPDDFSHEEMMLLAEYCANGIITKQDSIKSIRKLRN